MCLVQNQTLTTTMTVLGSQKLSIFTFFIILNRHPHGHLLKELLLPFIKNNYVWNFFAIFETEKIFKENNRYLINTVSGYSLPPEISITIKSIRKQKNGTFIYFFHKGNEKKRKIKTSLWTNQQFVTFDTYHIKSGKSVGKRLVEVQD